MFPEIITKNFDRVREIAFSELPIEEKMKLFDEFDEILVTDFVKNRKFYVKNCFLPIDGFEDYAVNPLGEVISSKGIFVRILSKSYDGGGYLMLFLCRDGKRYMQKVHRLVANTFLQNTEHKPQVNHIDGDKENNSLDNLEFCTAKENLQHAFRTGLNKKKAAIKIRCVETGRIYESQKEAAIDLNISDGHISEHLHGKRSHVGGYHFERVEEKEN